VGGRNLLKMMYLEEGKIWIIVTDDLGELKQHLEEVGVE